jgi:hypothetical protein
MKDIERETCRRLHSSLGVLPGYPVNIRITVTVTGGALSLKPGLPCKSRPARLWCRPAYLGVGFFIAS